LSDEDLQALLERLQACGLVWGAAGLPVNFRGEEDAFAKDLKLLAGHARGLQRAGATRVSTWLSPSHDRLTYLANFRLHAKRLRAVASVLDAHGLRLGLEYVGPWRSWTAKRFAFVHTLQEAQELIAEIGCNNVGLVLDSWHWYTAGETVEDLLKLQAGDIVACDLNDAPAGIELKDQIDSQRELPTASGVIDLKGFLSALIQIGYDGPVRAEPFNRALNEMDNEAAAEATAKAMRAAFALVS
jgi:sugar phosphate isomerase/epimerase